MCQYQMLLIIEALEYVLMSDKAGSSPDTTLVFPPPRDFLAVLPYLLFMYLSFQVNLRIKYQSFSFGSLLLFSDTLDIPN